MISDQWVYLNLMHYLPHSVLIAKEASGAHSKQWLPEMKQNSYSCHGNRSNIFSHKFCRSVGDKLFRVASHHDLSQKKNSTAHHGAHDVKEFIQETCPKAWCLKSQPCYTSWYYLPRCPFFSALHGMGQQRRPDSLCNDRFLENVAKPQVLPQRCTNDIQIPNA